MISIQLGSRIYPQYADSDIHSGETAMNSIFAGMRTLRLRRFIGKEIFIVTHEGVSYNASLDSVTNSAITISDSSTLHDLTARGAAISFKDISTIWASVNDEISRRIWP